MCMVALGEFLGTCPMCQGTYSLGLRIYDDIAVPGRPTGLGPAPIDSACPKTPIPMLVLYVAGRSRGG